MGKREGRRYTPRCALWPSRRRSGPVDRSTAYRLARDIFRATGATTIARRTPPSWVVDVYTPSGADIIRLRSRDDFLAQEQQIRSCIVLDEP